MSPRGKIRIEQRAQPRLEVKLPVMLVRVGHTEGKARRGISRDLSGSGIRVFTDSAFAVGDLVALTIEVPGESGGVSAQGEVVWARDAVEIGVEGGLTHVLGLRFQDVRAESASFIAQFVEKNLKGA